MTSTVNDGGLIFQKPGSVNNQNIIKIMNPTPDYPNGYIRVYNQYGQPLDITTNKPGSGTGSDTHFLIK